MKTVNQNTQIVADVLASEMAALADVLANVVDAGVMARFYQAWEAIEAAADQE
jgi:hypothetical protein